MPRTLVILPAWNEVEAIGETVREVRHVLPDSAVLVVDDGSTDGTAAAAREAGATVLRHAFNLGVAAAESTGLRYAIQHGFEAAVRLDGDGQHDPASAPALLVRLADGADLVLGSRFLGEGSFRSSALRRLGNRLLARVLGAMTGQKVTDPTSGFRAFGPRAMACFAHDFPHDYPEPESILIAARRGLRVAEAPVTMRARRGGKSSLTPLGSSLYMFKVLFALMLERLRPRSS